MAMLELLSLGVSVVIGIVYSGRASREVVG
jgi:hypothetical protein